MKFLKTFLLVANFRLSIKGFLRFLVRSTAGGRSKRKVSNFYCYWYYYDDAMLFTFSAMFCFFFSLKNQITESIIGQTFHFFSSGNINGGGNSSASTRAYFLFCALFIRFIIIKWIKAAVFEVGRPKTKALMPWDNFWSWKRGSDFQNSKSTLSPLSITAHYK